MRTLVLLDANHLMHRAYWAIQRNLATSKGEQTNAVFGVASMLLSLLSREKPDAVIACFDEGKKTLRHQEHEAYKAGRQETPDDFYEQIPRVQQCFHAFSIPILSNADYEADDLIGALAKKGKEQGFEIIIVTGDRDLFQMAESGIRIAIPHKGYGDPEYLDAEGVKEKLGVTPEQVPDYKGLVGDPSDNLKGVKGIGPKTAARLLQQYGNLEGIFNHLDEIKGGVHGKLDAGKESAFFCRKMARLVTDLPVELDLDALAKKQVNLEAIHAFFAELEFHTLKRRMKNLLSVSSASSRFGGGMDIDVPEEPRNGERVGGEQLPLLD